jgi:dihydrofolate reductase
MRKIVAFTTVSVDGYFAGPHGEIDWIKTGDDEEKAFTLENADPSGTLIFGHTTYEMMKSYWPTPYAVQNDPVVAGVINSVPKIVFSKTLKPVDDGPVWKNIRVFPEIQREEIVRLKEQEGGDIAILGSGTIVQQFTNLGLIDEYQLMVTPVILGDGRYLFKNFRQMNLKLRETRTFRNGKVFLKYQPS